MDDTQKRPMIRQKQMEAFSQAAIQSFEDRMVIHLNEFFSEQCKALGEQKTREAIRYGIQRAAIYGIVSELDVCDYIDLMFAFGRDFDKDPQLPWAGQILNDLTIKNPTIKVNYLYDTAMEYLHQATVNDSKNKE